MLRELKCLLNRIETPRSLTQTVCILLRPLGKECVMLTPTLSFLQLVLSSNTPSSQEDEKVRRRALQVSSNRILYHHQSDSD